MAAIQKHDVGYKLFIYLVTAVVGLIILFPLFWILTSSITKDTELFKVPIKYIPTDPTSANYLKLYNDCGLSSKLVSTFIITIPAILINLLVCMMASYGFGRHSSKGLMIAYSLIVFSIMVPAVVKARPLFTFFKAVHLYDTFPGLIILYCSNLIPFSMVILCGFLKDIPISMDEAATIDGADTFQKLIYVIIPLMRPAIATILMINFINCLNDLFTPLFYASKIQTLSVAITTLPSVDGYSIPWELVSAMGCVIILPIIIFVSIFQRQIMDGIMAGGVKA